MRVLVVGSGGREHALCWALRRDLPAGDLFCAPGNPGTAQLATNLPVAAADLDRQVAAAEAHAVDLVVVGPEGPLAQGLADRLQAAGRTGLGPSAAAARLESSKAFAKEVMASAGVPTARSGTFTKLEKALRAIESHPEPLVVKASGLAAGKGAIVCATRTEARQAVMAMLGQGIFGEAGRTVVIEEFLEGEELSVLAITNGTDLTLLPAAQDHKRLGEGDQGPNTGGMGAYSPVGLADAALLARVEREVLYPTLEEMRRRRCPFSGVLYAGLMVDAAGRLNVIEFNCRLGDPETQAILPRVGTGLLESFAAAARGEPIPALVLTGRAAVTTVLAAAGYPDAPAKGAAITIPETLLAGTLVFHGGTRRDEGGLLRTAAGRVLAVTGLGDTFAEARRSSADAAGRIEFEGKQYRRDIGWREEARATAAR